MNLLEVERELQGRGAPYVVATVVWRRSPSSGQVGARAVITQDGRIRGWLAGACAEPAVIRESVRALSEGTPRLVFLGPPEDLEDRRREGVVAVPISCTSEGALEVYVEPVLPRPLVAVIGRSPAAETLARLTSALGWRAVLVDDGGSEADHPGVGRVLTSLDLDSAGVDRGSFVVVATQGHYDEDALERALSTPASYIGLVASRKRATAVMDYLRARGVPEEQLSRVHAPAGLDLGRVAPEEIAVAILADLVQRRAGGELGLGGIEPSAFRAHEAIDPVCGMTVRVADARYVATRAGRTYYFCSAQCRADFEAEPDSFPTSSPA